MANDTANGWSTAASRPNPGRILERRPKDSGTEFAFEAFGLRIGIWVYDPGLVETVIERLPPGWIAIEPRGLDRSYRIEPVEAGNPSSLGVGMTTNDNLVAWGPTPEWVMDSVESQLQRYVAEFARPYLFVHAGVVRWHGSTIVLPGSSFSGKSTLVTALVEAGATYLSDEYAVLDRDGRVLPYMRRISLRDGPLGPAGRKDMSHDAPQEPESTIPAQVDLVLCTRFQGDADWTCERLGHGAAVLALCEQTVAIQRRPADSMTILAKVAARAAVYKGTRSDLESAVSWLRAMVSPAGSNQDQSKIRSPPPCAE